MTGKSEGTTEQDRVTFASEVHGSTMGASAVGPNASATGIVIVNHGLSFTEAEKLFGLLFEQNLPRLAEAARAEARRRVDEFAATFMRVAAAQGVTEQQLGGFAEPDVQFALTEAIQAAARRDEAELRQCLSTLVLRRLETQHDRDRIILTEAVSAMAKLTPNQMRLIALCFLVRHPRLTPEPQDLATFNRMLDAVYAPFVGVDAQNEADFRHLEYTGCGPLGAFGYDAGQIWGRWETTYPSIFQKPLMEDHLRRLSETGRAVVRELAMPAGAGVGCVIAGGPEGLRRKVIEAPGALDTGTLDEVWRFHHPFRRDPADVLLKESITGARLHRLFSSSWLPSLGLTPVGMAVAAAVIEAVTGERLDFDVTRPPRPWRPPP